MRRSAPLAVLPLVLAPLLLGGCQMNERMTGTGGGALAGGVLGGVVASSLGGVLVGAAAGALAGYLIGDYLADERERCSPCSAPQSPCAAGPGWGGACAAPDAYACASTSVRSSAAAATPAPAGAGSSAWAAKVAYERGRSAATSAQAQAAYREAIRLDPTRPEPWNALALQSLAQGERAAAREHLLRALELDPAYAPARYNLEQLDRGL